MSLTFTDHDLRLDSPWSIDERSGLLILVAMVPAILVLDFVSGREVSLVTGLLGYCLLIFAY